MSARTRSFLSFFRYVKNEKLPTGPAFRRNRSSTTEHNEGSYSEPDKRLDIKIGMSDEESHENRFHPQMQEMNAKDDVAVSPLLHTVMGNAQEDESDNRDETGEDESSGGEDSSDGEGQSQTMVANATASSLMGSIFGGGTEGDLKAAATSASVLFESNSSINEVIAKRQKTLHAGAAIHPKRTLAIATTPREAPRTRDEILAQRKHQASHGILSSLTFPEAFGGEALPEAEQTAEMAAALKTHGVTVVRNCIPRKSLRQMDLYAEQIAPIMQEHLQQHGISLETKDGSSPPTFRFQEAASRCPGRVDLKLKKDLDDYCYKLMENKTLLPILSSLLGGTASASSLDDAAQGAKLLYAGLIFNHPGSEDQPFHMDGMPLFPECPGIQTPAYAFNVFIPLTNEDTTLEVGPTEFIPSSHMTPVSQIENAMEDNAATIVSPELHAGDALIYDYRVCHRGTTNLHTSYTRRVLYLMYARPWFSDHLNFPQEDGEPPKRLFSDGIP